VEEGFYFCASLLYFPLLHFQRPQTDKENRQLVVKAKCRLDLSVAEASLRLHKTDDLQSAKVNLQPLVNVASYLLFWAPGAATLLRPDPERITKRICEWDSSRRWDYK